MSTLRVVLCSCPASAQAQLVEALLEERLVACVSCTKARSSYRWQGEVHHDDEVLLWMKTTAERVDALRERVVGLHPYEVPEVIVLAADAAASHAPYVAWVSEMTEPA